MTRTKLTESVSSFEGITYIGIAQELMVHQKNKQERPRAASQGSAGDAASLLMLDRQRKYVSSTSCRWVAIVLEFHKCGWIKCDRHIIFVIFTWLPWPWESSGPAMSFIHAAFQDQEAGSYAPAFTRRTPEL